MSLGEIWREGKAHFSEAYNLQLDRRRPLIGMRKLHFVICGFALKKNSYYYTSELQTTVEPAALEQMIWSPRALKFSSWSHSFFTRNTKPL